MIIDGLELQVATVSQFISFTWNHFLDDVLAVGDDRNKKVEMLNTERQTWQVLADYPYVKG